MKDATAFALVWIIAAGVLFGTYVLDLWLAR